MLADEEHGRQAPRAAAAAATAAAASSDSAASFKSLVVELEENRNKQDSILVAEFVTPKMKAKLAKYVLREKELEMLIKQAQKSSGIKKIGDELRKAVMQNDANKVRQMCQSKSCPVDAANFEGTTALIKAAIHEQVDIVDILIAAGASVNLSDDRGRTALMLAAANGSIASMQALLGGGCDCGAVALNGWTAFAYSAEGGHLEACKLLFDAGGAHVTVLGKAVGALIRPELTLLFVVSLVCRSVALTRRTKLRAAKGCAGSCWSVSP